MCLCVLLESQIRVEREKREGWGTYWVFGGVEEDERDDEEGCEAHGEERDSARGESVNGRAKADRSRRMRNNKGEAARTLAT